MEWHSPQNLVVALDWIFAAAISEKIATVVATPMYSAGMSKKKVDYCEPCQMEVTGSMEDHVETSVHERAVDRLIAADADFAESLRVEDVDPKMKQLKIGENDAQ